MKTAKISIPAVELRCPICDEFVSSPAGTHHWLPEELRNNKTAECDCCGATVKIPARAIKLVDT